MALASEPARGSAAAVGKRGLAEGKLEWKRRGSREVEMVPIAEVAAKAAALVR